jgi:hypothetical protein
MSETRDGGAEHGGAKSSGGKETAPGHPLPAADRPAPPGDGATEKPGMPEKVADKLGDFA